METRPKRVRYQVSRHYYGRPIVKNGPAAGCPDFPTHKWVHVTQYAIPALGRAKALADAEPGHAVVTPWLGSEAIYDNGKAPALPAGWIAAEV